MRETGSFISGSRTAYPKLGYRMTGKEEVLVAFSAEQMQTWPVSPRANSRKNNDPEIVAPIDRLIPIESALPFAILE